MIHRYIAYGAELCAEHMAQRCPDAVMGEVVALENWRFIINRHGIATLQRVAGARTLGLVWDLSEPCVVALDGFEGVATGNSRKVEIVAEKALGFTYLAAEERPGFACHSYLARLDSAAARLGLPTAYRGELAAWGGAVTQKLVRGVMQDYKLTIPGVHGPNHWLRVLENGLALAALTPGADAGVVELFALLHDSRRIDEDTDLGHGERAAAFVHSLVAKGALVLEPERVALLTAACERHEYGDVSSDPTIGCCWDADRLELARLGIRPRAQYLSTSAALNTVLQAEAWQRGKQWARVPDFAKRWSI